LTDAAGISRILMLVFTDLADSTGLKTRRGDQAVGELIARHRAHVATSTKRARRSPKRVGCNRTFRSR
jgi:hypothetical protein